MMSGDGFDGGDLVTGFLFGMLLAGPRQRETAHTHGAHWHQHVMPPGYHVHDGHPDGPIRIVPPTPEQLAAERARRTRNREIWAAVLAVAGLLVVRMPWLAVVLWGAAIALSATARSYLKEVGHNAVRALSDLAGDDGSDEDLLPSNRGHLSGGGTYIDTAPWDLELELVGKPHVRRDGNGRFAVLVRVVNRGRPLTSVYLTASLLDGSQIVGTASGWVDGPAAGQVRTAQLYSPASPPPFDGITLQVDEVVVPSTDRAS